MNTSDLIPENLFNAIGTTLLHSLWQGAVLAALTGIVVSATRQVPAAKRYRVLLGAFFLFFAVVTVTFVRELLTSSKGIEQHLANVSQQVDQQITVNQTTKPGTWASISAFVRANSNTIVLIWMVVVLLRAAQLAFGMKGVYRLKSSATAPVNGYWTNRVAQIAAKLGIKHAVRLAESGLAKVPMVIGHFKPLILIPLGLLTALSNAELEAIIAHELAHVRRRDYIVNVFISLVEILFFFNPAVLWLAALIREEREHCCDDIAISITGSKVAYIKALVACEEHQQTAPQYAVAFTGKGGLLNRVNRLLSGANPALNKFEKTLVVIFLFGGFVLTTAFTHQKEIQKAASTVITAIKTTTSTTTTTTTNDSTEELQPLSKKPDATGRLDSPLYTTRYKPYSADTAAKYEALKAEYNKNNYNPNKLRSFADSLRSLNPIGRKTGISVQVDEMHKEPGIILVDDNSLDSQDIATPLAKALVAEGIVAKVKSFKMTSHDLILNNRKLPDEEFQKFKKKYVRSFHEGTIVYYNYNSDTSLNE